MDSVQRIVSSMQNTATHLELPVPTAVAVRDIIGLSLEPAIFRLFGTLDESTMAAFLAQYRVEYVERNQTPSPLFANVETTLQQLRDRGHTLAVATGKMRRGLDRIWLETGLGQYFDYSRCADESESKPSPRMLLDILERTGHSPADAIMIGDSVYDMQMAEAIEMPRLGVSFGVHSREQLSVHQPLTVIDKIDDVLQWTMK